MFEYAAVKLSYNHMLFAKLRKWSQNQVHA